jgi:hypothetical protein
MASLDRMPVVAYLTDVEGQWEKLASFTDDNPCVTLDAEGRLDVADGAVLVFGGDAIDRGPSARRIVATLLEAKQRQPDQVFLLAGNRDINKTRLPRELGGHPPPRAPPEVLASSRADLLQWIFQNTMGAAQAFEHRRAELVSEGRAPVDDPGALHDAVVQSFLDDLAPGGALTRYLAACQLAYRSGATLFVHGGVTDENFGEVPGEAPRATSVDVWIARLNAFYAAQIEAYIARAIDESGRPGWAELVAYQAPLPGSRLNQKSVVYARPTDDLGNPYLPSRPVIDALRRSGITRVIVGHTPNGDTPSLLRDDGFELVIADNSYGRVGGASKLFLRGDELVVEASAALDDGTRIDLVFQTPAGDASPLGKRDADTGHLVTGRLVSGEFLLFRCLEGYRVEQITASAAYLATRRLAAPYRAK